MHDRPKSIPSFYSAEWEEFAAFRGTFLRLFKPEDAAALVRLGRLAQLVKHYANAPSGPEVRYSPAVCTGAEKRVVTGDPAERHISTSFIERQNLTMRMSIRRFTRLTNAFSKKIENHAAHVAIHFFFYNFCRPHASLGGKTPVQAAGVDSRRWTVADMVALLDDPRN